MLNLKSKKVLSALLSLSLAFEPMALAKNDQKSKNEQSLGNKIVQKAKKVVTHPGFYIPVGVVGTVVGTGAICLTAKGLYNNHKYSKPRVMDGSSTSDENIEVRDGYNSLDENEKYVYDCIVKNFIENRNLKSSREIKLESGKYCYIANFSNQTMENFVKNNREEHERSCSLNIEKTLKITDALKTDMPELFYMHYFDMCTEKFQQGIANFLEISLISIFSKDEIESKKIELENKVDEILNKMYDKIGRNSTDYDKAKYIHDYICENCKYFKYPKEESEAVKWKVQTAYGCLCEGKAVCEGIARAYQLLMNRAGVECRTIYGAANEDCLVIKLSKVLDSNLNHAWNIIKINGEWRHVDVTWDLPCTWYKKCVLRGGKYGYFLLTNSVEEIQEDHRIGIPYGNGNEEIKNANGYRNCNLPKEIAKDIKVYY